MSGITSGKGRKSIAPTAHFSKKGASPKDSDPGHAARPGRGSSDTLRGPAHTPRAQCPGPQIEVHWATFPRFW